MMLSTSTKSMCPFCVQTFTRLAAHLPRCKKREGRDYSAYLVSHPKGSLVNHRGRCSGCNCFFKRLDTHLRASAMCKHRSALVLDPPSIGGQLPSTTSITMNTANHQPPVPAPPPPVCVANKPNQINLPTPFAVPQSNESWEEDNHSLGCSLVHQVFAAQSVDDKNRVLCEGLYNHFANKYGRLKKGTPQKRQDKRHSRSLKRLTQEKNMARRELRAARREGRQEGVIKDVARRFHQLIRLHSKAKRVQLRSKLNLEAGKARQECAKRFWKFAAKLLDGEEESPEPAFSAEEAESFFTEVYSSARRVFQRPEWLPPTNTPINAFNDDPISTSEVTAVLKRVSSSSAPSPIDRISYKIFKNCPALVPALVNLFNACWESQVVPQAWKQGVIRLIPKQSASTSPADPGNFRPIALTSCVGKVFYLHSQGQVAQLHGIEWIS